MELKDKFWHVDGHHIVSVLQEENDGYGFRHICTCDYGSSYPLKYIDFNKENAMLIAASPDLLRACIDFMKSFKSTIGYQKYEVGVFRLLNERYIQAERAIKKALPKDQTDILLQFND